MGVDVDECSPNKKGETKNNCNPQASCKNSNGGFTCTCNDGYFGDGVTCQKQGGGGNSAYSESGTSSYTSHREPIESSFYNYQGTDTSLYTSLGDGECSLMGFEWGNLERLLSQQQWTSNPGVAQNYMSRIVTEFQYLGQQVLARNSAQCDLNKAGAVKCSLLYFPHTEHRCQLVQRLAAIYEDVAANCNMAWERKYGDMMNYLLANNQYGRKGAACEPVE